MTEIDRAEFFERSADVIRTYGHHKHSMWKGNDDDDLYRRVEDGLPQGWNQAPVCAWGAMYVAGGQMLPIDEQNWSTTIMLLGEALELRVAESVNPLDKTNIALWNDAEERTAEDVIEAFLHLAKDIRNGEV